MRRSAATATIGLLATGLALVAPASPAAADTVSSGGGTLSVNVTNNGPVRFACVGGDARVDGVSATPPIACSAVTKVIVAAGGGNQEVYASDLNTGFPALTSTDIQTGDHNDVVYASRFPDNIVTGTGTDAIQIAITDPLDENLALGNNSQDAIYVLGSSGNDSIRPTNNVLSTQVVTKAGTGSTIVREVSGARLVVAMGGAGNDTLDASAVTLPTQLTDLSFDGGAGNDTLRSGPLSADLSGGAGTNTIVGSPEDDTIYSESDTDDITPGAGEDAILDRTSLRSGGRTIRATTGTQTYEVALDGNDAMWRIRQGSAGTARSSASLHRPGLQVLPTTVSSVTARFQVGTQLKDRTVADVVALDGMAVRVVDTTGSTLVDITIPTGTWTTTGTIGKGSGVVDPAAANLGSITLTNVGWASVHGPWTNRNRGWGHRMMRDLLLRFASTAELDDLQGILTDGRLTRAQAAAVVLNTDEIRWTEIDRAFVRYLRRTPDAGGRTYWTNRLREGRALWRFRAQLFGSSEYYANAGGTNASYVTKAYQDVLGRAPDSGGRAYWTGKLDGGADRGSVALQFINSAEARRRLVDDQFLRMLGRLPTTSEQSTWVAKLPANDGEHQLLQFLAASTEYFNAP